MNIWKISIKNLKSKPFYTFLSIIILTLSIILLLGIQQLKSSFKHQIENNLGNIDLVIGAKGSPLQLILASVLHLDNPTGNISYNEAKKLSEKSFIKSAVPISYGDNYKGFRIIGTDNAFYRLYNAKLGEGRMVQVPMEAVIGNKIAEQLNLKLGDTFSSAHGLVENTIDVHDDEFTVVGILKPTKKVIDRLIITNLQSVWDVHNHEDVDHVEAKYDVPEHHNHLHDEHDHAEDIHETKKHIEHDNHDIHHHEEALHNTHQHHDEDKEITSILITFKSPVALLTFPRKINESSNMQAALPRYELERLYEYTSVGFKTIRWIAYLILIISGITIFINLYKMVKERAFDLALLRTYGASHFQIIKMILYEAFIIAFTAFITGVLFIKIGLYSMLNFTDFGFKKNMIQELGVQDTIQTGVLVFIMITLSVVLAIYPILKMNISTILSNEK